jgi:hypothetical protein
MNNNTSNLLSCILVYSSIFLFFSCGPVMKLMVGLPNLNVYSQSEIEDNIAVLPKEKNIIDAQLKNTLTDIEIKAFVMFSIAYRTYIYDQKDNLLCFNGEEYCSINQLDTLKNSSIIDNYEICNQNSKDTQIESLFRSFDTIQNNMDIQIDSLLESFDTIISKVQIPKNIDFKPYKHKILVFLNTDISKGEIKEDWNYIYDSLKNNPDILFIRVWADLNENFGLKKGAKARFKMRKVKNSKREYEIILKHLPYKQKN